MTSLNFIFPTSISDDQQELPAEPLKKKKKKKKPTRTKLMLKTAADF